MRNKSFKIIITLILIGCITTLFISLYKITFWVIDQISIKNQISEINQEINIEEVNDSNNTEIVVNDEYIDSFNPYWDYISLKLISVDFKELKEKNSDTIGWITVNGTNINYPFVQTNNNNYYLTHSFDKRYNQAGWIFMDYRNNKDEFDKNTIIYGHSRLDHTMFGTLKNILKKEWYTNTDNHIIRLSTEYENTLWQVFSIYKIKETSDYIETSFKNTTFNDFINLITKRSIYNFNAKPTTSNKVLTLSTCYNNTSRLVLHAKLIKKEKR